MDISHRCSGFVDHRCFSVFAQSRAPSKPYSSATLRPILSFHGNVVVIGRGSRRRGRRKPARFPPPLAARSSLGIDLLDTSEHHDGSLLFRFGYASKVEKNDELVEELANEDKRESYTVKVLDGDQEREVIVQMIDRENGSGDARPSEVSEDTRNVDTDIDGIEKETNVRDSSNSHAESSERLSDTSQEEIASFLQSDDKVDNLLEGVERKLDITESTIQHDEGGSLTQKITSIVDSSLCSDKSLDCEEAPPKDNDDETKDLPMSVKLEPAVQVSHLDVMEAKVQNAEDELHEVETEATNERDTKEIMLPTIMHVSHIKVTDATSQDVEEGLEDTNTVIDVMPPSNSLAAEPIPEEVNRLQSVPANHEPTTRVSSSEDMVAKDLEDRLSHVNYDNNGENDIVDVVPVPCIPEAEPIVNEEVSQLQSPPIKLTATMQVSDDTTDQHLDDGSHIEVTDATDLDVEDGPQDMNMDEGPLVDAMPPSDLSQAESDLEETDKLQSAPAVDAMPPSDLSQAVPISDETDQLQSAPAMFEPTLQASTTGYMDAKDQAMEEGLQQINIDNSVEVEPITNQGESQLQAASVKLNATLRVSDTEVKDTTDQDVDDGVLQVINEDASESFIKDLMLSSSPSDAQSAEDEGVNNTKLEQIAEADAPQNGVMLKEDARLLEDGGIDGKASRSELPEPSEDRAIMFATEAIVEREEISLAGYFLYSGAAHLEHPSKALTGRDDAYFVADSKWLGVASGVSQWSLEGIDPGVYAQELMKTCESIALDSSNNPTRNPVELLCRGVGETPSSGSSTVLIANFDDEVLHVANIGDTGFMIVRHGGIHKKSFPMFLEFNLALQVDKSDDPLKLVEEYRIELDEGDVIVTATDGLFDNLYEKEIAMIVSKSVQASMEPKEIAEVLAARAQEVGRSAFVRSPFADAAQAAGYTGYAGGKPDGVAVIVSLVEKRSNPRLH